MRRGVARRAARCRAACDGIRARRRRGDRERRATAGGPRRRRDGPPLTDGRVDLRRRAGTDARGGRGLRLCVLHALLFTSRGGGLPPFRSGPLTPIGTFTVLVLPSDNDTRSVTLFTSAGDRPLKRLRDPRPLGRRSSLPARRMSSGARANRSPTCWRWAGSWTATAALVVNGRPVVTGVALLADAWACTNPSVGRGMALGMLHARHLRDVAREGARPTRCAFRAGLGRGTPRRI